MTTEGRSVGRPATGQTPVRTARIGNVWDEAKAIADSRGEKMTAVVEAELRRYIKRHTKTGQDDGDRSAR